MGGFNFGGFGSMFQHTAARRRLLLESDQDTQSMAVSTHSRPKAAAGDKAGGQLTLAVSTHSRPKAAAPCLKTL